MSRAVRLLVVFVIVLLGWLTTAPVQLASLARTGGPASCEHDSHCDASVPARTSTDPYPPGTSAGITADAHEGWSRSGPAPSDGQTAQGAYYCDSDHPLVPADNPMRSASVLSASARSGVSAGGVATNSVDEVATLLPKAVHGNSASSTATNYLYRLSDSETGAYLKTGITKNPGSRYTKTFMQDKEMEILQTGTRREMLNLERFIVERDPGPLNREPWAGSMSWDVQ